MRIVLGFLSGLLGLGVGWFALAISIISIAGSGNEGGIAMEAFFGFGPMGGLVGFFVGVWLFARLTRTSKNQKTTRH